MASKKSGSVIEDLKFGIKETNSQITYYLSVCQRMEVERRYVDKGDCSIMMSAIDRSQLEEIHVPMCLDHDLSAQIIDTTIKFCSDKIEKLKTTVQRMEKQLEMLEKVKD